MRTIFGFLSASILIAVALLAGCAKKPPGCADPQTAEVIRSLLLKEVQRGFTMRGQSSVLEDDPQGFAKAFMDSVKVAIVNPLNDGYAEDARKFSCRSELKLTSLGGEATAQNVSYSVQATADDSGNFMVEMPRVILQGELSTLMQRYLFDKRVNGTWTGDYACGALEGSDNPLAGPFTMPVSMVVQQGEAKLERTTKAGGVETLTGKAGLLSIELRGEGRNTPEDTWQTVVWGDIKGSTWTAQGEIKTPEGRLLRRCTVTLNMPTNK